MNICLKFVHFLFGQRHCDLCKVALIDNGDFCELCLLSLPYAQSSCYGCGNSHEGSLYCAPCRENPPLHDRVLVLFSYTWPINRWIPQLKFNRDLFYGRVLGELYCQFLAKKQIQDFPEAIVPMPLALERYQKRGYNQANVIAREIAQYFKIPLLNRHCARHSAKEQALLGKEEREQNVQYTMYMIKPIPYRHVAILDDVKTTGATVKELTRVLKQWGVEKVSVWVVSRGG